MLYTKFWPAMVALAVIIGCGYTAKGNGADSTGRALTADSVAHGAAAKSPVTTLTGGGGRPQSVGLVLSGGGAKGIAHVGFIQALEDNDIPIDYIAGTSMGAIVGGLYACGYTPDEMMDLLCSKGFAYWSTGKNDPDLMYYFARQRPSPVQIDMPCVFFKATRMIQVIAQKRQGSITVQIKYRKAHVNASSKWCSSGFLVSNPSGAYISITSKRG